MLAIVIRFFFKLVSLLFLKGNYGEAYIIAIKKKKNRKNYGF